MNAATAASTTALLGSLLVVLAVAVRRRSGAAIVNTVVSLLVAVVATGAATRFQPGTVGFVTPELALWASLACLVHSIGMLGPYDSIWWWDHVTHTLSAALLAALVYAAVVVTAPEAWSAGAVGAATVGYVAVAGVFWELLELVARAVGERYDIEPVLVYYGWQDTAYDLLFDVVGAVLVVALDVRMFVALAETAPAATELLLRWTAVVFLGGSILVGVGLACRSRAPAA